MLLVTKYKQYVISKSDYTEALQQALGKKKFLPEATVEKLAEALAEAYGEKYHRTVFLQQTETGSWQFYTDESCERETRDDTVTKQWQRTIGRYHKTKAKPRKSLQVDEVTAKSKTIKSWGMTKAQVLKAVEKAFAK